MTRYTEINGEQFEVIHSEKTNEFVKRHTTHKRITALDKCYKRPSSEKRAIFNKWKKWAEDSQPIISQFSITSHNRHTFALGALYNGELGSGYIKITVAHNRLYLSK